MKRFPKKGTALFIAAAATSAATLVAPAWAQSDADTGMVETAPTFRDKFMSQVVNGSEVHGRVGIYDFRRWHDTNQPYPGQPETDDDFNTQGTNYGAQIGLQTGRIYGFSAGAEFVYEDSFYGNNDAGTKLNCNLACDGPVENLTQGYLQFNGYGLQLRGGRQLLNTPLAGADQFTFLPRSFNGVSAVFRPLRMMGRMSASDPSASADSDRSGPQITQARVGDAQSYETDQYLPFDMTASMSEMPEWQLFAAKIDRYEGRGNADGFVRNNRYFNDVAGFWSVGTTFRDVAPSGQYIAQYYHYTFQQTQNSEYGEVGYMAPTFDADADYGGWAPYARAQWVHSYDVDDSRVEEGIDSDVFGLKLGVNTQELGFSVFGNFSPIHSGSFNDGQFLHPYTDLSGVLYTDTMNNGIQEIGPGWAAGARFDFTPTDNLSMYARYVKYQAKHGHYHDFYFNAGADGVISDADFTGEEVDDQNSDAIGIGLTYDLGGLWSQLAGLKINDNLGITRFDGAPNFYNNRVRFYYSF
ncbi:hypothetical protein [Salinisphaera aquimarina]|uniref:Uncharacterized protein n=1 Tax=Salinisphaera aquimarina TaxID=2094031 RepID=A0ABV7EPL4_9GAMM